MLSACQARVSAPAPQRSETGTASPISNLIAPATETPSTSAALTVTLTAVRGDLDRPGLVFSLPDGTPAVIEQVGTIRRLTDGSLWLDVQHLVDANSSERGLFSAVLSPLRSEVFVSYTRRDDYATVVARIPLIDMQPDVASLTTVIAIAQPYANHNGGFMAFGPDDYLYIATGDGGSGNDPQNHAQDPQSLLGKVLRIDVRDERLPYLIPTSQPVQAGWLPEIVAVGLRNPWRFGFVDNYHMWIADVGQNKLEELNVVALSELPATNFGWRVREGNLCRIVSTLDCDALMYTDPVAVYAHQDGHCSITGGVTMTHPRRVNVPAVLYGDFCSGVMWLWDAQAGAQIITDTDLQISSFGRDSEGAIYVSDYRSAQVFRIDIK